MPITFTEQATTIWRDYNTDGVPASGKYSPDKSEIRLWGGEVEQGLTDLFSHIDGGTASPNLDLTGGTFSGFSISSLSAALGIASGGTGATTASGARTALGLVIGTDVQAFHARLADIANNLSATSGLVEKTGANTFGAVTVTAAGKALIDDATNTAQRATLGLTDAIVTTTLASQAEAEAGTNNTKLVTPLRVAQAITALASGLGVGQEWQSVTRSLNTVYQNTTGKPIMAFVQGDNSLRAEVSTDQATWYKTWLNTDSNDHGGTFIIPDDHYYRYVGGTFGLSTELR